MKPHHLLISFLALNCTKASVDYLKGMRSSWETRHFERNVFAPPKDEVAPRKVHKTPQSNPVGMSRPSSAPRTVPPVPSPVSVSIRQTTPPNPAPVWEPQTLPPTPTSVPAPQTRPPTPSTEQEKIITEPFPLTTNASPHIDASSPISVQYKACDAAFMGEVYETDISVKVQYVYEMLTRADLVLEKVVLEVENGIQSLLASTLVVCDGSQDPSPIQGISIPDTENVEGDDCIGLNASDQQACHVLEGTVLVYLNAISNPTNLDIRDQVWSILRTDFNGAARRHLESTILSGNVLGLYFRSHVSNSRAIPSNTHGNNRSKNSGKPVATAGLLGLVIFLLSIIFFTVLKARHTDEQKLNSYRTSEVEDEFIYSKPSFISAFTDDDTISIDHAVAGDGISRPIVGASVAVLVDPVFDSVRLTDLPRTHTGLDLPF